MCVEPERFASFVRVLGFVGLACGLLSAHASRAHAQVSCEIYDDSSDCPEPMNAESARGIGLGTGMRAAAVSSSALAYSPGALAFGNLYHIEGNVDYLADAKTVALGGMVMDSSTSRVGAGIGLRGFLSGNSGMDGLDGRLGLAFPISQQFGVGLLGRYISLTQDVDGEEEELAEGFTMDASFRIVPTEGFQVDLAAQNFVDIESFFVPVTLTAAVAFAVGDSVSLGVDFLTDLTSFADPEFLIGGGGEFLVGGTVPLRAGYMFDTGRETHSVSAGLGYTDQQVGLDLSLRQQVSGGDDTRVMAAARYYVN